MDYKRFPPSDRVIHRPNADDGDRENVLATIMAMPAGMRGALATLFGLGNSPERYRRGASQDLPSVPLSQGSFANALAAAAVDPSLRNRKYDFMNADLMLQRALDEGQQPPPHVLWGGRSR